MVLSARILDNVASVNQFTYEESAKFTEGDQVYVYFQLTDKSVDRAEQGFVPAGRRYMPASGSTLVVTLQNIDSSKTLTKNATQLYSTSDPSIWRITISSSDEIVGIADALLVLTEPTRTLRGRVSRALSVEPQSGSMCPI
jgi:hypothetical protein